MNVIILSRTFCANTDNASNAYALVGFCERSMSSTAIRSVSSENHNLRAVRTTQRRYVR